MVTDQESDISPSPAQPSKLEFVSNLIKARRQQTADDSSPVLKEVTTYFLNLPYEKNFHSDPVDDYWVKKSWDLSLSFGIGF